MSNIPISPSYAEAQEDLNLILQSWKLLEDKLTGCPEYTWMLGEQLKEVEESLLNFSSKLKGGEDKPYMAGVFITDRSY